MEAIDFILVRIVTLIDRKDLEQHLLVVGHVTHSILTLTHPTFILHQLAKIFLSRFASKRITKDLPPASCHSATSTASALDLSV